MVIVYAVGCARINRWIISQEMVTLESVVLILLSISLSLLVSRLFSLQDMSLQQAPGAFIFLSATGYLQDFPETVALKEYRQVFHLNCEEQLYFFLYFALFLFSLFMLSS